MPAWFEEEPQLASGEEFFMRAFWDLSTERQIGFALGPIPGSKLDAYGHSRGLDSDNMDLFRAVTRMLDDAYLKWAQEQQAKARETRG